jgi:ATP-dependent exoDNAse (exonuclease V) alpha subunit
MSSKASPRPPAPPTSSATPGSPPTPYRVSSSARQPNPDRHLYMVDESSLASTKQVRDFLAKLESGDRVLLIGDTRQHQGVEAGKPFEQLVNAGMKTAQLDQIVRQRKPRNC